VTLLGLAVTSMPKWSRISSAPVVAETDRETPLTTGTPAAAARRAAAVETLNVLKVSLPLPETVTVPVGTSTGLAQCRAKTSS